MKSWFFLLFALMVLPSVYAVETYIDATGNGNNFFNDVGTPTLITEGNNTYIYFDGSNSIRSNNALPVQGPSADFAVTFNIKWNSSSTGNVGILAKAYNFTANTGFFVRQSGSSGDVYTFATGNLFTNTGQVAENAIWENIAVVSQSGRLLIWVNGTLDTNISRTMKNPDTSDVWTYIGREGSGYVRAGIDDVRFYNTSLTQSDVTSIVANSTSVKTANLFAWLTFENVSTNIDYVNITLNASDLREEIRPDFLFAHYGQFPYGSNGSYAGSVLMNITYNDMLLSGGSREGARIQTRFNSIYPTYPNGSTWYLNNFTVKKQAVQHLLETDRKVALIFNDMPATLASNTSGLCTAGSSTCNANNATQWANAIVDFYELLNPNSSLDSNVYINGFNEINLQNFFLNSASRNSTNRAVRANAANVMQTALIDAFNARRPDVNVCTPDFIQYANSSLGGDAAGESMFYLNAFIGNNTNGSNMLVECIDVHDYADVWEMGEPGEPPTFYEYILWNQQNTDYVLNLYNLSSGIVPRLHSEYGLQDAALNNYSLGVAAYENNLTLGYMAYLYHNASLHMVAPYTWMEQSNCGTGYPEYPKCWNEITQGTDLGNKNLTPYNVSKYFKEYFNVGSENNYVLDNSFEQGENDMYMISVRLNNGSVRFGIINTGEDKDINITLEGFTSVDNITNLKNGSVYESIDNSVTFQLDGYETNYFDVIGTIESDCSYSGAGDWNIFNDCVITESVDVLGNDVYFNSDSFIVDNGGAVINFNNFYCNGLFCDARLGGIIG